MQRVLNQIIAIEKGVKSRVYARITELHKSLQKSDLLNGLHRTYQPKDDSGEPLPPENKRVQVVASEALKEVAKLETELMDVTAIKDWANCQAKADIVVDGEVLVKEVPATYLLFLEKQLADLHTMASAIVTLDEAEEWSQDPNSTLFRSKEVKSHRTRKVQRPLVLYQATKEHPAQTQLITEDVIDGFWTMVKTSGALPVPRKQAIVERIEKLADAVKEAREKANLQEVEDRKVGAKLMAWLLA